MKKITLILIILLSCTSAFAQMSDQEVIDYTMRATKQGVKESRISAYLISRGVTPDQVLRIKNKYNQDNKDNSERLTELDEITTREVVPEEILEIDTVFHNTSNADIYGHEVFRNKYLSFEPNLNIATPQNYKLGPGDELVIEIWGASEAIIKKVISAEGKIFISQVGPLYLNGLTISEASNKIRKALSSKYSGLDGDSSNISVSLGNIRTISVNIMGEVFVPGTYRLSSLSSVFHAIYRAGGISESGSLRDIQLIRDGKSFAHIDIYQFLFEGKSSNEIFLEEGDVIVVPPYSSLVHISGEVKRATNYELKEGESLQSLLDFAGGFKSGAYTKSINIKRFNRNEREIQTINEDQFSSFPMQDGDSVVVSTVIDRYTNRVEITGCVMHPDYYELGEDIATVKQLVLKAEGLKENAFTQRAIITRTKDNLDLEIIPINIGAIMNGSAEDVLLKKDDKVTVLSIQELQHKGDFIINGLVARPGAYRYAEHTTIEDLIMQAGGLLEGASMAKIDVARRLVDPMSISSSDSLGTLFSFQIREDFSIENGNSFYLEPNDVVSVRESPGYSTQKYVEIIGELSFPGRYVLLSKEDRVSALIDRAGGLTKQAYIKGAKLIRQSYQDTTAVEDIIRKQASRDTIDISTLKIDESYSVAVDLEKALDQPGSEFDIVLKTGDRLIIPEYDNTVRIMGEIMHANAVGYVSGKNVRYYVDRAGGFSQNAKRSCAYIIYANGEASKAGLCSKKVEPGCIIVVPARLEREKISPAELTSIASATTSMTYVIALLSNLFLR